MTRYVVPTCANDRRACGGSASDDVADVLQKAMLAMSETGLEAAAATAVIIGGAAIGESGPPPTPTLMLVDRPYLVAVVDVPTGAILFLGHIVGPTATGDGSNARARGRLRCSPMCTLITLFGVNPEVPLVVAANRDELYARPWAPPAVLSESPRVVGGRDLTQQGTWLGVTSTGFFVGVTNQRTYGARDATRRSRGQLTLDALRTGSVESALEHLRAIDAREYNPFNLLVGDARALHVVYARGEASVRIEALPAGIWVLNNDTIGSRDFPKANRARDLVAPIAREPWPVLAPKLMTVLGDHVLPPLEEVPALPSGATLSHEALRALQAICVHTPTYGTSSATLLAIGDGKVFDYRFAAGPPDVTPFEAVAT